MGKRVLVVDDEKLIVKGIRFSLMQDGMEVDCAYDGEEALELAKNNEYDLLLLDVMLPKMDGFAVCQQIRDFSDVPIVMLTAKGDDMDKILGLEYGADDYITKPFKPMELIYRVRNALRKSGKTPSVFQVQDLHIDAAKGIVMKAGSEIILSALEYRLLLVFLNHFGETLSRRDLLHEIWDVTGAGDYVNDNTLTVYIKRLRDKIESDPANPAILKTVRGLGYKIGD